MSEEREILTGHCQCGGVAFEVRGRNRAVTYCHCEDCRRTTGHFHAALGFKRKNVTLTADETLVWYASSDHAERGFCSRCGGNLFWRARTSDDGTESEHISIQAGMFDLPTGLTGGRHIFVASKSDYYEINDDLPKVDKW